MTSIYSEFARMAFATGLSMVVTMLILLGWHWQLNHRSTLPPLVPVRQRARYRLRQVLR